MTWDVGFADSALRGLDRLPVKVARAVVEFATFTLPANPLRMSHLLQREFEGLHFARRGDYRILFSLDEASGMLTIVRVSHRRDAYRLPAPR